MFLADRHYGIRFVTPTDNVAAALIEAGATVRVTDWPFASFEGVCLWSKPRQVAPLMQVFGRATEIEIERSAVMAA